jgi:hypothetical protein
MTRRRKAMKNCARKDVSRNRNRATLDFGLVFLFAMGAAGCLRTEASTNSKSGGDQSAYAQHAHHTPAYKPRDLPGAVKSLQERCAQLFQQNALGKPTSSDTYLQETLEIAGWFPELAGDSDLERAEWDRVNEASKQLVSQLTKLGAANSDASIQAARKEIEIAIDAVDAVVHRNAELFPASQLSGSHDDHEDHAHHSHSSL